jgi:hypothetical protein
LKIEEFAPEIIYVKSTENIVVNALSRLHTETNKIAMIKERL